MATLLSEKALSDVTPATDATSAEHTGGVTPRAIFFSLFLAALFGYCIPIVDFQMANTFLGAPGRVSQPEPDSQIGHQFCRQLGFRGSH
jgi:hypothetical protein